jgi:type I restriction enzyme S subunit
MKPQSKLPLVRIDTVCDVKGGKRLPKGEVFSIRKTDYPYIRVTDFNNNSVSLHSVPYITRQQHQKISRYTITTEDIYVSVAGSLGIVGIIPNELNGANLTENANKLTNITCNQKYLLYALQTDFFRSAIEEAMTSAAQPKLAIYAIESTKIPLPPLPTQNRIAAILQTWDRAIQLAEQQLEDLQTRKRGLMQLLLTGKKRLPEFEGKGEWDLISLSDLGQVLKGTGLTKEDMEESGVSCIRYAQLYTTYSSHITEVKSYVLESKVDKLLQLQQGDILLPSSGEDNIDIGKASVYLAAETCVVGGDMLVIRPAAANSSFLAYALAANEVRSQFYAVAQGVSVAHIYRSNLSEITVRLPKETEQNAIASIMETCDESLQSTKRTIASLRLQKCGLMQRLIEGEVEVGKEMDEILGL